MSDPGIARTYDHVAIALGEHIRFYTPKCWCVNISNVDFAPRFFGGEAKALLHAYKSGGSLEKAMTDIDTAMPLQKLMSRFYVKEAIFDFFNSGEYKKSAKLDLGVVGYCPPTKFDEGKALAYIKDSYNRAQADFPDLDVTAVSGLTNVGVIKLAYEEAKRRGWRTWGIACEKANEFKDNWFPVDDRPVLTGDNWGDESIYFINSIDALVRIGGGPQSHRETAMMTKMGKQVYEYEL